MVDTLLAGRGVREPPTWAVGSVAVVAAIGGALATATLGVRGLAVVGLAVFLVAAASFMAFAWGALWLRPVVPVLGLIVGAAVAVVGPRARAHLGGRRTG